MDSNSIFDLAAKLLGISPAEAEENSRMLPEISATYIRDPRTRGGGRVIIAADGTFLYAASSVSPEDHIRDFSAGKRTDIKLFDID